MTELELKKRQAQKARMLVLNEETHKKYQEICEKRGFDELKNPLPLPHFTCEDEPWDNKTDMLTPEEISFLGDYFIAMDAQARPEVFEK